MNNFKNIVLTFMKNIKRENGIKALFFVIVMQLATMTRIVKHQKQNLKFINT